ANTEQRRKLMGRPSPLPRRALLTSCTSAAVLAGTLLSWAQQPPSTPLAAVSSEVKQYPAGSRLREDYDTPNQLLAPPPTGNAARSTVLGFAAAARAQAALPEGFTVLQGTTQHIGPSGTRAGAVPNARAAAAPIASPDEKFITVHPLAYRGV